MNFYSLRFFAVCPVNGVRIEYAWTVQTDHTIKVEALLSAVARLTHGFHEDFAEKLFGEFGGQQTLVADHHGVNIRTERP